MKPARLLVVSVLASACAATSTPSEPAAETLRSFEPVDAPRVAHEAPAPGPVAPPAGPTFLLAPPPAESALPGRAQDPAAGTPTTTTSPHRFSGGAGIRFRDGDAAFDLLLQYQYFVNTKLDIGAIADWAFSPIDSLLVAPAAWWHPNDRLTLFGAPGLEIQNGDGIETALRLGGSYRLMLEKLAIRPFGWYDFVTDRDDSFAIGIAIGI